MAHEKTGSQRRSPAKWQGRWYFLINLQFSFLNSYLPIRFSAPARRGSSRSSLYSIWL